MEKPQETQGSDKPQQKAQAEAKQKPVEKAEPSLSYAQPRAPLDQSPQERAAVGGSAGNANMTNHDLNDPALRRTPDSSRPEAGGRSATGPLARDEATPSHEDNRRARDMHDADQRGRLKGVAPRNDVEAWHQAEEERQGDLPGKPRQL